MKNIIDYSGMPQKKFWSLVAAEAQDAHATVTRIWDNVRKGVPITPEQAIDCLNALFIDSHSRLRSSSKLLARYYPTKQYTKNTLKAVAHLWWLDHYTTGISALSTLNWFSSKQHKSKKTGKMRYNGASTHFVIPYHGLPYYIIPIIHKAWHEPKRNNDSLSVEMVNAGGVRLHRDVWCYWPSAEKDKTTGKPIPYSKPLPKNLVKELPPLRLDSPFRGHNVMQPFTTDQVENNIILKRIILMALGKRIAPERMSQHQDWRSGKADMGPLWPFVEVNESMFTTLPLEEYGFIRQHQNDQSDPSDSLSSHSDTVESEVDNPEYGVKTPTQDDDSDPDSDINFDIEGLQTALVSLGYVIMIDGIFGRKTRETVLKFQQDWNRKHYEDLLILDGLPGPNTNKRIQQQLEGV